MGIVGRVWQWIFSFLQDRKAACKLQEYIGPLFETDIGLPQGSVIDPLLFILFIIDIYIRILVVKRSSLQTMVPSGGKVKI